MVTKNSLFLISLLLLVSVTGCNVAGAVESYTLQSSKLDPNLAKKIDPTRSTIEPTKTASPGNDIPTFTQSTDNPPAPASPTSTSTATQTPTETGYAIGDEITIEYLRKLEISGSEIAFEQELEPGANYRRYLASYKSEGNKIFGLLTIPTVEPPEDGFKAIVFNHGYIPPSLYRTTERYVAYVDYLARSGFVVFKIDYRGHGQSEGEASGSYFSPGYTIDAISALKSLQKLDMIDPQGIGMWGHSMAGNLVMRAMLIEPDIKAGVIWAGAVYSYDDFTNYGIDDNTYRPPETPENPETPSPRRRSREIIATYGRPDTNVTFWKAVSLTENINYLSSPIQLHHAQDDPVVNIGYSIDLAVVLKENGLAYEFYSYEGGGHNLISPYFDQAMLRTVAFFQKYL